MMDIINTGIPIPKRLVTRSMDSLGSPLKSRLSDKKEVEQKSSNETLVCVDDHGMKTVEDEIVNGPQITVETVECEIVNGPQITVETVECEIVNGPQITVETVECEIVKVEQQLANVPIVPENIANISGRQTPLDGRTTPHQSHSLVEPEFTTIATTQLPEMKQEKRKYKQRNLDMMRDLSGLTKL
ncbi:hypothetical protein HDV01_005155, partial [Terramyces sp. JEL0728]